MQAIKTLFALSLLSTLGSAQYVINPDSVPLATREGWCTSQTTECPLICLQYANTTGAEVNTCNATILSYECLCTNGMTPNSSEYSQTLPYFVCTEWGTQCVTNCGADNNCANDCRADHPCGAQDPVRINTTSASSSTAHAATSTSGSAATTSISSYGSSSPTSNSAATYGLHYSKMGNQLGYLAVAAGMIGGLAFLS